MKTLHVCAAPGAMVEHVDETGRPIAGRFVAHDRHTRAVLDDGEHVADSTYLRRAIAQGDLVLLDDGDREDAS